MQSDVKFAIRIDADGTADASSPPRTLLQSGSHTARLESARSIPGLIRIRLQVVTDTIRAQMMSSLLMLLAVARHS